ncbi:MAG: glutathione S-transferase family protein [Burkholderiales bacterium]
MGRKPRTGAAFRAATPVELYHSTHSTCSQKVRICLAEKGLAWTGHHLNLRRFDQLKPEFLALNPAGVVPVLVDGGQVLIESRIINEYLEGAYAQPRLCPFVIPRLTRTAADYDVTFAGQIRRGKKCDSDAVSISNRYSSYQARIKARNLFIVASG